MTREFEHYHGCNHRDPDNCGACALTDIRQYQPNYAAWPLVYMENRRAIPAKWRFAFRNELRRTDNPRYVANLRAKLQQFGVTFTDGQPL